MSPRTRFWKPFLILLLALIIGRFVVVGVPKVLFNHLSSDGDESAYLSLGLALRESGVLTDGTRPPLYSLVLSPFAEREWPYFTTAKLVTLGIGSLTVLAVFGVGARLFGWQTGLLAAFLIAANKELHLRATTVYADTLLALVMIGAWYFLIKSLDGWKNCLLAGLFVGLAFLTKGSAPVLLAAWGLTALLHYRLRILRHFELLLVPLVFVVTSLPLLIYNAREFGSPTYNFATEHIMWMDQLEQINTASPEDLPTFSTYFATHTPADMVSRIQRGSRRLNPVVARSVIPGRDLEPGWLGPALGFLAVGVLIFLLVFQRQAVGQYLVKRKNSLWFTLFLCSIFYAFFTWYVAGSSAETRFVVPLLGPLYLLLADAVVSLTRGLGHWLGSNENDHRPATSGQRPQNYCPFSSARSRLAATVSDFFRKTGFLPKLYRLILALVIGWGVWWLVDTAYIERWALSIDPYESDREANADEEEIVQWLSRDNPANETLVIFGPSKSLPLWKFPARFTFERLPVEVNNWPSMQAYVQTQKPDYIIVDSDTARRRRQALSAYFRYENEQVRLEEVPPGWALDFVYPKLPCQWCIFSPVADTEPMAVLEDSIELLSFRVANEGAGQPANTLQATGRRVQESGRDELPVADVAIQPGQQSLRVILTWRTRAWLPDDYTVFVHLTAPDGFVKAQHDRPPFDGAIPTSQWKPGEVFADRYELELDDSVTPGDYLLLAGMYDPATGKRLAVIEGPTGPVRDTILLRQVSR